MCSSQFSYENKPADISRYQTVSRIFEIYAFCKVFLLYRKWRNIAKKSCTKGLFVYLKGKKFEEVQSSPQELVEGMHCKVRLDTL